ncbi:hypothetical protein BO82DRAFT_138534 [Aspergillus uvarum CBS 121591]|uniref:Uncharacterized protein n=1 Tax=Aspergillus uvarum CBS 121591 TaxID=1448315 RepID=A0A319DHU9_9EURO|nr:hypothetical protein BO82DRAFT_138534 [Aspergillus uvarum CBS 121591]PYH79122.1 hypothetical protein BO82DRAFT_138534 [Aspergillus uvarum CBS 121591]
MMSMWFKVLLPEYMVIGLGESSNDVLAAGRSFTHYRPYVFLFLKRKVSLIHCTTHFTLIHQLSTCLGTLFSLVLSAWHSTPIHLSVLFIFLFLLITFILMSPSPDAAGS